MYPLPLSHHLRLSNSPQAATLPNTTSPHPSTDITTGENVIETLVSEGLVQVRRDNLRESAARLVELEDTAKAAGKGKWAANASVSTAVMWKGLI